jgi:endonuclease YncB( thermonuclease family)
MKVLFALILVCSFQAHAFQVLTGTVSKITDGDTVVFKTNDGNVINLDREYASDLGENKTLKVRMMGLDAPEEHFQVANQWHHQGHWAKEATARLAALLRGAKAVQLQVYGLDKYKRTLGKLILNGKDLHEQMIRDGHAVTYFYCSNTECGENFFEDNSIRRYEAACREAKAAGKGIWDLGDPLQEMPFEFRARLRKDKLTRFVGNLQTMELVQPEDYKKVSPCSRVFFDNSSDARRLGFH